MAGTDIGQGQITIDHSFLCLKCRGSGHVAGACMRQNEWTNNQFAWFFSPDRMMLSRLLSSADVLCSRCKDLSLVQLLRGDIPWRSPEDLIKAHQEGHALIRTIGQAGSIEFRSSCPVCICLFGITPSPSSESDDIFLCPDYTGNRLAGENGTQSKHADQRMYAKCLLVFVDGGDSNLDFYIRSHRGDAICILEDDLHPEETLGGRVIQMDGFNLRQCNAWLESCRRLHGKHCDAEFTEKLLGVRLVDVDAMEIVAYPGHPCDYAALSYVWGDIEQESFRFGSQLTNLSKTIEDAISVTKLLGKKYLWVDALCIDQNDENDKNDQIARMWSIYRGSSVTLVTLSSSSAESGLARFSPAVATQPQLACTIDGVRLVSLMPTLSQYIWVESWGSRAWTLQEALLSHRCLYISNHQLYFECEGFQCCESLNESRSYSHNLNAADSPDPKHWRTWVTQQCGSGCLRDVLDTPAHSFLHWAGRITLYSYRKMSKQEDGLRAFSGILERLGTMYKAGFFWGTPVDDFQWGLLWQAQSQPQRRPGFPSWCWAGWQVGIRFMFPADAGDPHRSPFPLRIWKSVNAKLVLLFDAETRAAERVECLAKPQPTKEARPVEQSINSRANDDEKIEEPRNQDVRIGSSPKFDASDTQHQTSNREDEARAAISIEDIFHVSRYQGVDEYALFIESGTIQLKPDWGNFVHESSPGSFTSIFVQEIAGSKCAIFIMTRDPLIDNQLTMTDQLKYLLLAVNVYEPWKELKLLVVYNKGLFCTRATSMSLYVRREDMPKVLKELKLQREYIVLF